MSQLEHNASSHFVDATKLARKVGTVNIHALFSHDELQSASKAAAAEEKKTITELIAAHIDTAKAREVSSTPLKFHDQIRALWEYDKMIQLSDVDVKEAAYAATLVDNLVKGGIPEPAKYRQAIAADHPERGQGLASSMQRERKMCLSENPMVQESIGSLRLFAGSRAQLSSRLQKLCAQSSAESEIYAVTDSVKEAIHVKLLCEEAELRPPGIPLVIWEDNTACIHLGHGLKGSKAAKHFEVRLRFLNEQVQSGAIEFAKIDTKDQLADGFT